jgi:predicted HNH restriction endonuclease
MANCLNCNHELNQGRNCTAKYCHNQCQSDHRAKLKLAEVEQGTANAKWVKRYLIEKHGNVCMSSDCAWDFTKVQVNVEIEHVDGNSENNTLENCILLCPNCHSLTPTYKNRNMGKGRASRRQRYAEGKSY